MGHRPAIGGGSDAFVRRESLSGDALDFISGGHAHRAMHQ
jgi:hypothetical protein